MSEDQFQLLYKKLTKEISPSEETEFENWLNDSSENELLFRRMKDAWDQDSSIPRIKGQKATFEKISRKLNLESEVGHPAGNQHKIGVWEKWHKVAAIIAVFLTFAALIYFSADSVQQSKHVAHANTVVKTNPAGQKTRINLPDGSVCWLNSESEINYFSNFSDTARNIYLQGEAYFEVAKDASKPFRVHTNTMTVTALGTIFNVTSFPGESQETVALVEGKISVKCYDQLYAEVLPGEAIEINRRDNTSTKLTVEPYDYIAWKNGELIIEDSDLLTIIAKLERWYGVKIEITGELPEDWKFKARFRNQTLINVLESMKYGRDLDYKIDGKNIDIIFN